MAGASLETLPDRAGFMVVLGGGDAARLAVTDENGRFRIDELAAGPWRLLVRHPEHPDHVEEGETALPGEVVSGLSIRLARGYAIEGRVQGIEEVEPGTLAVRAQPARAFGRNTHGIGIQIPRTSEVLADGRFRVGGLAEGEEVSLTVVDARQGPFGTDRSRPVKARAGDRGVVLRLSPGISIRGRVIDARSGRPVEKFMVEVGTDWLRAQTRNGREVREHPDGRFEYSGVEVEDGDVTVQISADGYRLLRRTGLRPRPDEVLDLGTLALEPAPLFPVRVVAAGTGEPVAHASVRLAEVGSAAEAQGFELVGWSGPGEEGEVRKARTDERGVAMVTAMPGRTARLLVRANGFVHYRSEPFTVPAVTPAEPRVVELLRGGTVVVRVVDREGVPVPGVAVEHREPQEGEEAELEHWIGPGRNERTGADGVVRFERLQPGVHRFRVARRGGGESPFGAVVLLVESEGASSASQGWTDVAVVEGGRHELTLVAPPAARVHGLVTEAGRALPGALVELRPPADEEQQAPFRALNVPVASGRADGRGAFELAEVDVGTYRVLVHHGSRAMPWEAEVVLTEGDNELVLDLPVTAIEGRVVDDSGRPLEGASVRVVREQGGRVDSSVVFAMEGGAGIVSTIGPGGTEPATTDEHGRFRLRGVLPNVPLTLRASREGGYQEASSETLEVAPGEVRGGVEIVLHRGGSLAVRVVDEAGEAVGECFVTATFAGESDAPVPGESGFTSDGEEVLLEGLRPGPWRLVGRTFGLPGAEERESEEIEVEVRAGERVPVTLRLPPR